MREPSWRQQGEEPDYRFSLANERTFLAWIRTALAVLAGGVLLDQFSTKLGPHIAVTILAITLSILAALLCGLAYIRWRANEIAMRHAQVAGNGSYSNHQCRHSEHSHRDRVSPLARMRTVAQ